VAPTKEELEVENATLRDQLDDALAAAAEAEQRATVLPNTRPAPTEPSFAIAEGTRAELEANGYALSPFTGARLVGDGDSYREVEQDEFDRVVRERAAERARAERAGQQ
jgi:hypothetical protein